MAQQTTVQQFLNDAATEIMAINPGGSVSGTQLTFWLRAFNLLAANGSTDRALLFYVPDVPYIPNAFQEAWGIGPGAFFDTSAGAYTRPVFVESARALVGNSRRWPLNVRTEQEWASNPARGRTDNDGPLDVHYSASITTGVLRFAPLTVPGNTIWVSQWNPLRTFDVTELNAIMEDYYPPEYLTMLRGALALDRTPSYKREQVSQILVANALEAYNRIKALNNERLGGSAGQSATLQAPAIGIGRMLQQAMAGK